MPTWERILGSVADIIQIGDFFNFDKITNISNTNGFILLLVLVAWFLSNRRKKKEINAMQSEIDKMAREIRVLMEDALLKRGLTQKGIHKIFPPDDKRKTKRKK